ncbi:MAG: HPP family protein [Planctomycetes bacterium]|nr:HPP family protein [Planctomycetota bacterium]
MLPPPLAVSRPLVCALQACVVAGLLGLLSLATHTPFLFPALGASAYILIAHPELAAASARNVLGAHLVAAATGWVCFRACGLEAGGTTLVAGGSWHHVASAALALGATTGLLLALRLQHPPACATTLIVALGFLPHAWQVAMVGASALLLLALVRLVRRITPLT